MSTLTCSRWAGCPSACFCVHLLAERCPQRQHLNDPFHLVKLGADAHDDIRRKLWNRRASLGSARSRASSRAPGSRRGRTGNVTGRQETQARARPGAQPTAVPQLPARPATAPDLPGRLRRGDRASRHVAEVGAPLPARAVRQLARTITKQRTGIEAAIRHELSNARVEQVNTVCGWSSAARSGSTPTTPRSRSRCSRSAESARHSPAGDTSGGPAGDLLTSRSSRPHARESAPFRGG